jgi:hypothetical protein
MIFLLALIFISSELTQLGARRYVEQRLLPLFRCIAAAQQLQQQRVRPLLFTLCITASIAQTYL